MRVNALLLGLSLFSAITLGIVSILVLLGIHDLTAPQLLTLSALWLLSGYVTAMRVGDAGILQGLLANILGLLFMIPILGLMLELMDLALVENLANKSLVIFFVLAGMWGSAGGLLADIFRILKLKGVARSKRLSD